MKVMGLLCDVFSNETCWNANISTASYILGLNALFENIITF